MYNERFLTKREEDGKIREVMSAVPLYSKEGTLADKRFRALGTGYIGKGTNCEIETNEDKMIMRAEGGTVSIIFENTVMPNFCIDGILCGEKVYAQATPNGAVFFCRCAPGETTGIKITTNIVNEAIRKNNKYVAFMQKPFRPSLTVSSLYSVSADGMHYRPLILDSDSFGIFEQNICFYSSLSVEHINVFEINMHEPKLIQDTTVESATVTQNNAYGATAFLGRTDEYGEQWLYLKANMCFFKHMRDKELISAKLHIPILSGSGEHLQAFLLKSRFCSFGSNWNNKLAYIPDAVVEKSISNAKYVTFDITPAIAEGLRKRSEESAGILILSRSKKECTVLATADCYAFSQFMEVMYM